MRIETQAELKADEAIEMARQQAAEYAIRARQYQFSQEPAQLESIQKGLSRMRPRKMYNTIIALIGEEMMTPRHNFSSSGCIPLVNLHGALRYSAMCCAIENRESSR